MTRSPVELGEALAPFIWEGFSDLVGGLPARAGVLPADANAEEALIFVMWIHTRACQQAFAGRASADAVRAMLDALHRSVYETMEAHGIPAGELPLFEQRVSARYYDYYSAVEAGGDVATLAAAKVAGEAAGPALVAWLAECAVAAGGPLRDFLADIELRPHPPTPRSDRPA